MAGHTAPDARRYVPVLKLKQGEKRALALVRPAVAALMTPLLEVVESVRAEPIAKHLSRAFHKLDRAVEGLDRYLLDPRELAPLGEPAAREVFRRATDLGKPFTPVVGISRASGVRSALDAAQDGLAIRLERGELEVPGLGPRLMRFVGTHALVAAQLDLLVDLGSVDLMVTAGVADMALAFLREVPQPPTWRSVTLLASAYPKRPDVGRNSDALVERVDWKAWRDVLYPRRSTLRRMPAFGDSAIQHPAGVEGFDPKKMRVSATLRYATQDNWLLVKGEATDVVPPSTQFPRLARRLTTSPLEEHFEGEDHCSGCEGVVRAAGGAPGYGSATTWRCLGTVHHITTAVEGLRALSWP